MTDHALSPKASRGDAVQVSWGLVQIPVRLFLVNDTDRSIPARSMFIETDDGDHPVGKMDYDKITGKPVDSAAIVKKSQVSDGRFVELTDAEIESHSTLTRGRADIVAFVPIVDVREHYIAEKQGVWAPEKMKVGKTKTVDPTAAKAAQLLRSAMLDRGVAALVMLPTRGGGQYVVLFPDGRCAWLVYAENVRQVPLPEPVDVTAAELEMAGRLVEAIGIETPVLHDEAGARLRTYLEAKATGTAPAAPVDTPVAAPVDLMAALAASVEAKADKPAGKSKRKVAS